jgi:hypothetical protein
MVTKKEIDPSAQTRMSYRQILVTAGAGQAAAVVG